MTTKRVGLIARHTLPDAVRALTEAATWLEAHGCVPVIDAESAVVAGLTSKWAHAPRASLPTGVDIVVAFGGDGTLLDAAGHVTRSGADVPVLGVNLGRLGFLTEVGRDEVVSALSAWVEGRTRTEARLMLLARVESDAGLTAEHLALNDVVVSRGAMSRMIEIDVTVDEQRVCYVKADGVIVASATGSTAYNLSAGGPIVHPAVDAVILTPIAPHTLTNRPLVLPASMRITLRRIPDQPPAEVQATFDGQAAMPVGPNEIVTIQRAPRPLRLVRTSARTHFDMLREKLKWGNS
jgi:NAD+ kinase